MCMGSFNNRAVSIIIKMKYVGIITFVFSIIWRAWKSDAAEHMDLFSSLNSIQGWTTAYVSENYDGFNEMISKS